MFVSHQVGQRAVPSAGPVTALRSPIGIEKGTNSNDDISRDQQGPFKVVASAINHEETNDESTGEQADRLEQTEVQTHIDLDDPAQNDHKRHNK